MDLTMRQVVNFIAIIDRKKLVELYHSALSYRLAMPEKFPSLDEFLGVTSREDSSAFDPDFDKRMEAIALKKLEGRQRGR
jgi:hypothetical protein